MSGPGWAGRSAGRGKYRLVAAAPAAPGAHRTRPKNGRERERQEDRALDGKYRSKTHWGEQEFRDGSVREGRKTAVHEMRARVTRAEGPRGRLREARKRRLAGKGGKWVGGNDYGEEYIESMRKRMGGGRGVGWAGGEGMPGSKKERGGRAGSNPLHIFLRRTGR